MTHILCFGSTDLIGLRFSKHMVFIAQIHTTCLPTRTWHVAVVGDDEEEDEDEEDDDFCC